MEMVALPAETSTQILWQLASRSLPARQLSWRSKLARNSFLTPAMVSSVLRLAASTRVSSKQLLNSEAMFLKLILTIVTPTKQKTFFANAVAQGLPSPVFTANLKKGTPGNYNFGYIDSSEYTGSITYVPVTTANGFWEFTGNGYAIGTGAFTSSSIDAIADTGTTLLYLPSAAVTAYYAKVSGAKYNSQQGGYVFPCSATLPSITLGIGSYRAVVPGSYINYAPVSSTCKIDTYYPFRIQCITNISSPACFGGIQSNTGIGFSIYGDIFLKSQFVVFNSAVPQLGFAAKPT